MRLAQQFAVENEFIRADAIESTEFPDLTGMYRIYAVPKTLINATASIEGALPEGFFLDKVLEAVKPPTETETS